MYFLHIVLLIKTILAMDIEITGELAFDLKISNLEVKQRHHKHKQPGQLRHKQSGQLRHKQPEQYRQEQLEPPAPAPQLQSAPDRVMRSNMTAAPVLECPYQYPEQEQIDAMLSNMMNQLTKVFVRAHGLMKRSNHRRMHEHRFSVVQKKNTTFFEKIYNNMTEEYKDFYNNSTSRVARSGRDPCAHQEEVKRLWVELLDTASRTLHRASLQCVREYLQYESVPHPRLMKKLQQFLIRELEKIRINQLALLCDKFQLCYHELQ